MKETLLIVLILLLSCCSRNLKNSNDIGEIAVDKAFETNNEVVVSDLIKGDIKYVQLESNEECLLGRAIRIFTDDSLIIAVAFRQIYLFDKNTGKFIREIGHYGRDPGGYLATVYDFPFNETQNTFFARGYGSAYFNEYDSRGNLIKEIKTPNARSLALLNDSIYIGYIPNHTGNEKTKLIVFDIGQNIIKEYPNFRTFEPTSTYVSWPASWFYKFENDLFFFELFTDTIFQITEKELLPKYQLKLGEYAPPYEMQGSREFIENRGDYFFTRDIFESQRYLFFSIEYNDNRYCGIYDKKTEETKITSSPDGFENDIDNFIPFQYYSVNNNGELVGFKEAYEIVEWFNNNPSETENLPPSLQKLKNITENDNPIVMIAKLKE